MAALELGAHEFAQVYGGALGGVVGEVALGVTHEPAHARDDDDGCGAGQVRRLVVIARLLREGGLE